MDPATLQFITAQHSAGQKDQAIIDSLVAGGWEVKLAAKTVAASYSPTGADASGGGQATTVDKMHGESIAQMLASLLAVPAGAYYLLFILRMFLPAAVIFLIEAMVFFGQDLSHMRYLLRCLYTWAIKSGEAVLLV